MRLVRFLIKLSFICNICFLLGYFVRMMGDPEAWSFLTKHVTILGWLVAAPLNILTVLIAVVMLLLKKVRFADIHPYVFVLNVLILLIQLASPI